MRKYSFVRVHPRPRRAGADRALHRAQLCGGSRSLRPDQCRGRGRSLCRRSRRRGSISCARRITPRAALPSSPCPPPRQTQPHRRQAERPGEHAPKRRRHHRHRVRVADLRGAGLAERARRMIAIAHPDQCEQLERDSRNARRLPCARCGASRAIGSRT